MFERYTERARRVLFFAHYEAERTGYRSIETEHLLLGLIHDPRAIRLMLEPSQDGRPVRPALGARLGRVAHPP